MNIETKMKLSLVKVLLLIGLTIFVVGYLPAAQPNDQEQGEEFGVCAECHEDACADFKLVRHGGVKEGTWTKTAKEQETLCVNCHGDPTKHIEEGGGPGTILSFRETEDVQAKTQQCLSCHSGTRARFFASPHGKAAMDCTNCHDELMKATPGKKSPTKICISCHEDVYSEFMLNERHRLQEGIMECTTCHDQHAPATRERLGGFSHEACIRCHTDKGGPFLYEHEASRIEGCRSCHVVHGSPNRRMLTHQSISDLCFSCHTMAPSFHSRFTSEGTNCTTCHATIHGSNLDRLFLK